MTKSSSSLWSTETFPVDPPPPTTPTKMSLFQSHELDPNFDYKEEVIMDRVEKLDFKAILPILFWALSLLSGRASARIANCLFKRVAFNHNVLSVVRHTTWLLRVRGMQAIVMNHMSEAECRLLVANKVASVDLILGGHKKKPIPILAIIHQNGVYKDGGASNGVMGN